MAAEKIMTMTSGEKPRSAASGPMMGMETVAIPEVEGIRNERPKVDQERNMGAKMKLGTPA